MLVRTCALIVFRCLGGWKTDAHDLALIASEALVFKSTLAQKVVGGGRSVFAPNEHKGFRSLGLHALEIVRAGTQEPLDMDVIDISCAHRRPREQHDPPMPPCRLLLL